MNIIKLQLGFILLTPLWFIITCLLIAGCKEPVQTTHTIQEQGMVIKSFEPLCGDNQYYMGVEVQKVCIDGKRFYCFHHGCGDGTWVNMVLNIDSLGHPIPRNNSNLTH